MQHVIWQWPDIFYPVDHIILPVLQPFNLNYHFLRFSSKDPLYVTVHYLTSLWQIFYIHFQRRQKPVRITIIALTKAMGRIPATILVLAIAKKGAVIISRLSSEFMGFRN